MMNYTAPPGLAALIYYTAITLHHYTLHQLITLLGVGENAIFFKIFKTMV
jgi:hypothetical protein